MRQRTRTLLGSLTAAFVVCLSPVAASADTYWQCVPFARMISGVQIFGDAWTWWRQAAGKYETGNAPRLGAVLCFQPTGRMRLGHVGVVSQVITERVVLMTHANWSRIGGTRGQIERDVTVIDVSPSGDWSQVKVWYDPVRDLGGTTYPTYGFIYNNRPAQSPLQQAQNTAVAVAQSAASSVISSVRPGGSPLNLIDQAMDSTDRIAALIAQATAPAQETPTNPGPPAVDTGRR